MSDNKRKRLAAGKGMLPRNPFALDAKSRHAAGPMAYRMKPRGGGGAKVRMIRAAMD